MRLVPRRTVAPVGEIVTLPDLKVHLRIDHDDDDALIRSYERAAMALLDGWRGILGRCILEQTWEVSFDHAGTHRLPFPDVSEVTATDVSGDPVAAVLYHDAIGSLVTLPGPATVTMTAALPEDARPAVVIAVKLLVGHWYLHREAVTTAATSELPLSIESLLTPLRIWRI